MSVVAPPSPGPRISSARLARGRLSVRPHHRPLAGRAHPRQGADFQEWIKFDIQYVERASFGLDLWIIWKTIHQAIRGVVRS